MRPALLLLTALAACDNPAPGEACTVSGDGFTRYDPCEHSCINWELDSCPTGPVGVPDVCSAGPCTDDADCPAHFDCLRVGSVSSECLPEDTCPFERSGR